MQSLMLLLVLILMLVLSVSTKQVCYVKPSNSSLNCSHQPCLTLDQYTQQSKSYFTTGTTFLFLPGNHSLQTTVKLINVSNITLRGIENDVSNDTANAITILCKTGLATQCENVTNLKIQGMTFVLYSSHTDKNLSVLSIFDSKEVLFLKLSFQGSSDLTSVSAVYCNHSSVSIVSCFFRGFTAFIGAAIYASDRSNVTLDGNVFIDNRALHSGGAIYADQSSLILKESMGNTFTYNSAKYLGGALLCQNCKINMTSDDATETTPVILRSHEETVLLASEADHKSGIDFLKEQASCSSVSHATKTVLRSYAHTSYFSNNKAKYGGAIYLSDHSVVTLSGTVAMFQNNLAQIGGAICSNESAVTSNIKHLCFTGNRAQVGGGAYFGNHSSLNLGELETNTHYFANNSAAYASGGAIHYQHGSLKLAGSSQFTSNYVAFNGSGGALYVLDSNFTLSGRISFTYNFAEGGGAIYMIYTTALFDGKIIDFVNNSAYTWGGGIMITVSSLITKMEQINFVNNSAGKMGGGGLYIFNSGLFVSKINFIGNSAFRRGGGIFSLNSTYRIVSANFINNTAWYVGGAILSRQDNLTCHNINITGNSESAVFVYKGNVNFSGDTRVNKNVGNTGGGIGAEFSAISFTGFTLFEENAAHIHGGAIAVMYRTTLLFSGVTSFINNRATDGAAIHGHIGIELAMHGVILFERNNAVGSGGAIFASETHVTLNDMVSFMSNSAQYGGAMYFENGVTMTLERNTTLHTSNNYATKYGGAIYHRDSITPSQCKFVMNEKRRGMILTLPDCFLEYIFIMTVLPMQYIQIMIQLAVMEVFYMGGC